MGKLLSPLLKIWWYCRNLILASAELWQATRSPTLTWNFHEKQDIMLMEVRWVMGHGWIMLSEVRWMQVLTIGICQIPFFCCHNSPAVLAIWHRLWGMLPITIKENISPSAGKKTYLIRRMFSYWRAILLLCCLLSAALFDQKPRFDILTGNFNA